MFNSKYFIYNGINSIDMGVDLVRIETGMIESRFGESRNIIEDYVQNKNKRYNFGLSKEPLTFSVTISLKEKEWTTEKKMSLIKWLFQEEYKDFVSTDDLSVVYKCLVVSDSIRFDNSMKLGFATLVFRCDSSHAYTPLATTVKDFADLTSPEIFEISNHSNVLEYYYPEIEFELIDFETDFKIKNLSNNGEIFEFTDLVPQEKVYIDNDNKIIVSSIPDTYRLGNLTDKKFFRLVYGVNQIEVYHPCILSIRSQFPIGV